MTTPINDIEERLTYLKEKVPTRGLERHPLMLNSVSELSDELKSPAVTALASEHVIESIIAFPPQIQRGLDYVPKQALLFTATDVIHVLASIWPNQEPQVTSLQGRSLLYMDVTLILLYGNLEIVAEGNESLTRLSVEFNSVAWYQISPPLRRLLQATKSAPGEPTDKTSYSAAVNRSLENLPFKFSNGLKIYGLLPGEELEDLVFQAGAWKHRLLFLRKPISANTLLLFTSNFVVVMREKLGFKHGWIITYIPRKNILGIQNQPGGLQNEITIRLKRGEQTAEYKLSLMRKAAQEWRERWSERGYQWEELPDKEQSQGDEKL